LSSSGEVIMERSQVSVWQAGGEAWWALEHFDVLMSAELASD